MDTNNERTKWNGLVSFLTSHTQIFLIFLLLVCVFFLSATVQAQTPVERHGQLSVQGNRIVDKNGNPVQLRGMSLYWSQWKPAFYNASCVKWLRDDWCVNVVRAAMAVNSGGLATNSNEKQRIFTVIDACIANGIYVIVDYHDHTANTTLELAKSFFDEVSKKYKGVPNILYEPWNEPLAVSWSSVIKPYHQAIVSVIRKNDPSNIIICGTAQWSQKVGDPAADPVTGTNIAYTLHYYAASHKQWLRDAATSALNKGIALFVTEYGTSEASGNGVLDEAESRTWWDFMEKNYIGHCNWSVADLGETSAALKTGTGATGNWPTSALKPSGVLVRNYLRSKCTIVEQPKDCNNVPGGLAVMDGCNVCTGGTTGTKPCKALANGYYSIKPLHSSLCLQTGATITQQTCNKNNTQVWQVIKSGNFYEIRNTGTNQYLNVAPVISGTDLSQTTSTANRLWRLEDAGNGTYHLVPSTNFTLLADVSGGATSTNISVGLWTRTEAIHQQFTFTPATVNDLPEYNPRIQLRCFPNPFTSDFQLETEGAFDYTVYDVTGNEMEKGSSQYASSIGKRLSSGMYIVKVHTSKGNGLVKINKL